MTTEPLNLDEAAAILADNGIDGPDLPYNPRALAAMRTADALLAELVQARAEIERLIAARAELPGAIKEIVFGTNIARSLIYTEKPETLVAIAAQRIWSNLDAYFACGDWPDRRCTAEEVDAEEADYRAAQPARKRRRPGGASGVRSAAGSVLDGEVR